MGAKVDRLARVFLRAGPLYALPVGIPTTDAGEERAIYKAIGMKSDEDA